MERIDAMLDKLIRIQHPDIVLQDTGKAAASTKTFVLESPGQAEAVGSMHSGETASRRRRLRDL